ncbi:MAG: YfhO family protein [Ferruginibacter sp.]
MKNAIFQKSIPHLIAVGIFLLVSVVFCLPVFQGMAINQSDMSQVAGWVQQSKLFYAQYGKYPLWTNSMFGGMPAYQILIGGTHSITLAWFHKLFTFFLPQEPGLFFLACISFYILSQILKVKPWIGIMGALAYSFVSYNAIIVEVGHIAKFAAMGYAPMLVGGIILLTQKKYTIGFLTTLMAATLMMNQNHVQIVYYIFIILVCLGIAFLYDTIKNKEFTHLFKTIALAISAAVLAVLSFATILLPTQEYVKESMRGGRSELTLGQTEADKINKSKGGLDKDYAFQWSYGIGETFTTILPNYLGSNSGPKPLGEKGKTIEGLTNSGLPEQAINSMYGSFSAYWGKQPGTSGPVYFGAVICLLFIASLFFVDKKQLLWLLAATVIGTILAWGNNLKIVNYFLFDHLPYYNKFRAPSMAMIIPQFTVITLAILALQNIFYGNIETEKLFKKLKYTGIVVGIVIAFLAINYVTADFKGSSDKERMENIEKYIGQMMAQGKPSTAETIAQAKTMVSGFKSNLIADRKAMYLNDFLRMLLYLLIAVCLIWFTVNKKIKPSIAIILLAFVSFADIILVSNRYLNNDNYVTKDEFAGERTPTAIDNQILADKGHYRVFNQAGGDPFQEANTSYFHNSIGGYSPVKLGLYQDLITHQLSKGNFAAFNMLNTKYIIGQNPQTGQPMVQQNPDAAGNAWFVKNIKYVNSANEEMLALDSLKVKETVVIDNREKGNVAFAPQYDSTAKISLIENKNDVINYQATSTSNQFAVFSEVYYPKGWKAYIDDKETPIAKVNYILRGLSLPAGNHKIRFEFKSDSYIWGNRLSLISGVLSFILLFGGVFFLYKKYKKNA